MRNDPLFRGVLARVGWLIPFHVQIVFSMLRRGAEENGGPVDVRSVDEAIERLLAPSHRSYFEYWRERLESELGPPESGQALALLNVAARSPDGVERSTLSAELSGHVHGAAERDASLAFLLGILTSDGNLVEHAGRWRFRSTLLGEYWRRRLLA